MGLYQRGNVWWYKFKHKGQMIVHSTGLTNKNQAQDVYDAEKASIKMGRAVRKDEAPTLNEFGTRFLDEIRIRSAAHPETIQFYEAKWKGLAASPLGSTSLDRINPQMISRFIASKLDEGYERATVNRYLATLRRAMRLAYDWEIIDRVPRIHMLDGENKREFVLSWDDQKAYLNACPEFLRNFATLALETGMRRKELRSLRWADIHWEPTGNAVRGFIHVDGTKSSYSKRDLTLTQIAREVLVLQKEISKCDFVFVKDNDSSEPCSFSTLNHAQVNVRRILNMPEEFVLHSLRHTFGTRLGEAGADAFTIMRIMGHSSVTVSQRYVHPTAGTKEQAFLALEHLSLSVSKIGVGTAVGTETRKKPRVGTKVGTLGTGNVVAFVKPA